MKITEAQCLGKGHSGGQHQLITSSGLRPVAVPIIACVALAFRATPSLHRWCAVQAGDISTRSWLVIDVRAGAEASSGLHSPARRSSAPSSTRPGAARSLEAPGLAAASNRLPDYAATSARTGRVWLLIGGGGATNQSSGRS